MISNDHQHIEAVPGLLRELESRLDHAYAAFGDLAAALPRARVEAKLSGVVGQPIFDRFTNIGVALTGARGHVVSTHRLLEKLAGTLGIEVMIGDERPKPNDAGVFSASADDTVVEIGSKAA